MGEFFLFFLVSLSAACLGWGMVVVASRIEHERQERYAERYGKRGRPVPVRQPAEFNPSPSWPISPPQPHPQAPPPACPAFLPAMPDQTKPRRFPPTWTVDAQCSGSATCESPVPATSGD